VSKIQLSIVTALILFLSAAAPRAEEATLDALLNTIKANRTALVGVNLGLSAEEAAAFWPVYDRYQEQIGAMGERLAKIIEDYAASFPDFSNEKAMKLVEDYLQVEADRVAVRRSYLPEFAKALPGRKVARLYQMENKMDAVIRFDLAATIPVMEGEAAAPPK
jgi:hypothetical protein